MLVTIFAVRQRFAFRVSPFSCGMMLIATGAYAQQSPRHARQTRRRWLPISWSRVAAPERAAIHTPDNI